MYRTYEVVSRSFFPLMGEGGRSCTSSCSQVGCMYAGWISICISPVLRFGDREGESQERLAKTNNTGYKGFFGWCHEPPHLTHKKEARDRMRKGYFSDFTWSKFFLYLAAALYVLGVGFISLLEPFMEFPCEEEQSSQGEGGDGKKFPNPSFPNIVCLDKRHLILLGFSRSECGFARRLIGSVILGGLIGWERRQADR